MGQARLTCWGEEVKAANRAYIPFSHSHPHLSHTQDRSRERGEAGDQADAQWSEARADWNHHALRGTEGVRGPIHAVQRLHAPETLPGELTRSYLTN